MIDNLSSFFPKVRMDLQSPEYCTRIILFNYFFVYLILGLPVSLSSFIISQIKRENDCLKGSPLPKFNIIDWLYCSGMQGIIFVFINLNSIYFKKRLFIQSVTFLINTLFTFIGAIIATIILNNDFDLDDNIYCSDRNILLIMTFIQLIYSLFWIWVSITNLIYLMNNDELSDNDEI